MKNKTYNKKKVLVVFLAAVTVILGLIGRLCYLMIFDAEYYQKKRRRSMNGNVKLKPQEEKL